jgi:hypothetical protein
VTVPVRALPHACPRQALNRMVSRLRTLHCARRRGRGRARVATREPGCLSDGVLSGIPRFACVTPVMKIDPASDVVGFVAPTVRPLAAVRAPGKRGCGLVGGCRPRVPIVYLYIPLTI